MRRPNKFDGMMHEYCLKHGFCGSLGHVTDFIPKSGEVSADDFVEWLLQAEGLEGYDEMQVLKDVFRKHMGGDKIDAKQLCSSYRGT